jgi:hypothetical protein
VILYPDRSAISRNPGYLSREKVERSRRVVSIWDLNGSYDAFIANLRSAWLIDIHDIWIWKGITVVFHGDILADRHTDGIRIMSMIDMYRRLAVNHDSQIIMLAGNHEDVAISHITGGYRIAENTKKTYAGVSEFDQWKWSNGKIFSNMQQDEKRGRRLLEMICQMQLIEQVDDTLFIHVAPSDQILRMLIEYDLDSINTTYLRLIRGHLLWESQNYNRGHLKTVRSIFFDPDHRIVSKDASLYTHLRVKYGINTIIHGHVSTEPSEYGWVRIISSDHSFGKWSLDRWPWETPNVTVIERDGVIYTPDLAKSSSIQLSPDAGWTNPYIF